MLVLSSKDFELRGANTKSTLQWYKTSLSEEECLQLSGGSYDTTHDQEDPDDDGDGVEDGET